jgi:hypothetical protein
MRIGMVLSGLVGALAASGQLVQDFARRAVDALGFVPAGQKRKRKGSTSGRRFGRRAKYKGRLHARRGARKGGSGRTAKCMARHARRHGGGR